MDAPKLNQTLPPSTSTFIAPDVSALKFIPDPDTRKMTRSRKRAECVGPEKSFRSKVGKKHHITEIYNRSCQILGMKISPSPKLLPPPRLHACFY